MDEQVAASSKIQIILGVFSFVGVIGGAVISNWDKFQEPALSRDKPLPAISKSLTPPHQVEGMTQITNGNGNVQVSGSNNVINSIDQETRAKLESIDNKANTIISRSERQPQITMAEFVQFSGKKRVWYAPNKIFPGSIVELHGFRGALHINTDNGFHAEIFGRGWDAANEVVIIGRSGEPSSWRISADSNCEGKVIVFSSPRIRSLRRSWSEERTSK